MERIDALRANIERVIVGKTESVELAVTALLAQGHLLIEDIPGVGKTTLARALARSIDCEFQRIQFTPDLLPSDILGVSIYDQRASEFRFRPGPIFASVVLADEINRATPRTQAALLEAMGEQQVTIERTTYPVPRPFLVVATQNPIEYEGTFPLPESQLDRFALGVSLGYVTPEDEARVVREQRLVHPLENLAPVMTGAELIQIQEQVKTVRLDEALLRYMVALAGRTRTAEPVRLGASPRGSIVLYRAAQAWALLRGRDYVVPDDVKAVAVPVLAHRLVLKPTARYAGVSRETVVRDLLEEVPVPI